MFDTEMSPKTPLLNKNFILFKDKWPKRECQRAKGDVEETWVTGEKLEDGRCCD